MKPSDLMWQMADLGDGSRGAMIEAVLGEEFEDQFKSLDDMAEDIERERTDCC